MIEITVSGDTHEAALDDGLQQLGVSDDLVEATPLAGSGASDDDLLPGAAPLAGITLRLRVREDALLARARAHLKRLLQLMGVASAHIEVLHRRGGTTLSIVAPSDGPLIIGRNGQNLEALQILVNRMLVHGGRDLIPPFAVDSEGYRERRLARIEQQAERAARTALRDNREVELEPMSASERRVVHHFLKTIRGVHTISRGEGPARHIVVTPGMPSAAGDEGNRLRPTRRAPSNGNTGPASVQIPTHSSRAEDEEDDD